MQSPFANEPLVSSNTTAPQRFQQYSITGFDAELLVDSASFHDSDRCAGAIKQNSIHVQKSIFLHDDVFEIARDLDDHPMVQYPLDAFAQKAKTSNLGDIINKSWNHLGSSCAYLKSHQKHLCVSRVIFRPARPKDRVIINFLRGRIFDQDWNHLHGYEIRWHGRSIVFPKIFDVGTPFIPGKQTFGPEDPRIIVEDLPDAEPVIVFNMAIVADVWYRAMLMHRPFTNHTVVLSINGVDRAPREKNWTPFFLKIPDGSKSNSIHFIWKYAPLTVLKCGLADGICDITFQQSVPQDLLDQYSFKNASIRGGTQFIPIPRLDQTGRGFRPGVQAFVSLVRHHVEHVGDLEIVNKPGYRPEIAVLMTDGILFYLTYVSSPLDFGVDVAMSFSALADVGSEGRIMIANSIDSWNFDVDYTDDDASLRQLSTSIKTKTDVMTITLSVNDETCQVMQIAGIYGLLRQLPSMKEFFDGRSDSVSAFDDPALFNLKSLAAWSIRACVEQAAMAYTIQHSKGVVNGGQSNKQGALTQVDAK